MWKRLRDKIRDTSGAWPVGRPLVKFDARGCMADDFVLADRGVISGRVSKGGIEMYLVRRKDGSTFRAIRNRCDPVDWGPRGRVWPYLPEDLSRETDILTEIV